MLVAMTVEVQVMTRFATDLKSKHEGVRNKAAKDLYTYVTYKYSRHGDKIQLPAQIKHSFSSYARNTALPPAMCPRSCARCPRRTSTPSWTTSTTTSSR